MNDMSVAEAGEPIPLSTQHSKVQPRTGSGRDIRSRLDLLCREHRELDRKIAKMQRRPGHDSLELAAMKRTKLQLKDEIALLGREVSTATV